MQQLYHAHNLHELEVYSNPELLKKGVLPIELFMKFMEICEKPRQFNQKNGEKTFRIFNQGKEILHIRVRAGKNTNKSYTD